MPRESVIQVFQVYQLDAGYDLRKYIKDIASCKSEIIISKYIMMQLNSSNFELSRWSTVVQRSRL